MRRGFVLLSCERSHDLMIVAAILYAIATTALGLYGVYVLALVAQCLRYRRAPGLPLPKAPVMQDAHDLPAITVQLPLYNEPYVAGRIVDAAAALDWPRHLLHIQVLDDSTDDTTAIARARVEAYRRRGIDMALIHRSTRAGYKAGALANGLTSARGEYVAIFDADFVPAPDFLKRLMPHFAAGASIGFVQARWEHLNYRRSALARALAIAVDGHFVVEQFARSRSGWPVIFNGSAGIWRRLCIEDSGGWHDDTLCEDMDLSFRAMLAGWRGVFVPEVVAPQEEPESIGALKLQHARWAKGGAQCLRKHAVSILRASSWSPAQKAAGFAYFAGYTAHLFMVLVVLLWLPLAMHAPSLQQGPLAFFGLSGLGLPMAYVVAQWALHRHDGSWLRRLSYLPLLLVVGFGVAFSNALAVLSGLMRRGGEFHRTPKGAPDTTRLADSRPRAELLAWLEMGMALYAAAAGLALWITGHPTTSAFVAIFALGFGSVGIGSLIEIARVRGNAPARGAQRRRRAAL